jgi:hypothetical protein
MRARPLVPVGAADGTESLAVGTTQWGHGPGQDGRILDRDVEVESAAVVEDDVVVFAHLSLVRTAGALPVGMKSERELEWNAKAREAARALLFGRGRDTSVDVDLIARPVELELDVERHRPLGLGQPEIGRRHGPFEPMVTRLKGR